jgi:flagellar biogenesis protein FliO
MDTYSLLRTLGALVTVLGMLAGALWMVRRYGIRLPGRINSGATRRLDIVERTAFDSRRSVVLLRRDGREHLILLAPEGNILLEAGLVRDELDHAAETARLELQLEELEASRAQAEALRESFFAMVDKARAGVMDQIEAAQPALDQLRTRLQPALAQVTSRAARGFRG